MKRFVLLLPVVVILVFSGCSSSKSSQTTPEEALSMEANLVMKNLEARGGADRIKTIQSLKQTGEVYVPAFGVTASITTYHLRPNKFRSVGEAMGMEIVSAYDGETPWSLNPMVRTRPYRLSGMEAIALREQACLDGVLSSAADLGYTLEYAGRDSVNGTAAHRVRLQRPDESDLVIYLDAETFLEIKSATRGIDPFSNAEGLLETYITEYRDVEGVKVPARMEVMFEGKPFQQLTFLTAETNIELDPALFASPLEDQ